MSQSMKWLLVFVAVALCAPLDARAYVDPGTGSFILQMLVAGFLAAWLYARLAWTNTKMFFARLFSGESKLEQDAGTGVDDPEEEEK